MDHVHGPCTTLTSQHFKFSYRHERGEFGPWRLTWSITSQYFQILYVEKTPQPKSIISICVHFWLDFGSNWARIWSRFHSKMGHFELEFHSIFSDFLWIYYQFSVIFSQFLVRGSTGIDQDFDWFSYDFLLNLA